MNMKEMLSTRMEHEALTEKVRDFLEGEGYETFTLSTESCDFCERCAYLDENHAVFRSICIHVWKAMAW